MPIRKNQRNLTRNEKRRFVAALKELKSSGVYDRYVKTHWQAMMGLPMMGKPDPAHGGPAFLAWHREYLKRFEEELQRVDPSVTIPYWNWVQDQSNDGPPWTDDFLGGDGRRKDRQVTTGPFAYSTGEWPINVTDEEKDPNRRREGSQLPHARDGPVHSDPADRQAGREDPPDRSVRRQALELQKQPQT